MGSKLNRVSYFPAIASLHSQDEPYCQNQRTSGISQRADLVTVALNDS
jgi:hypothetical protein